MTKLLYAGLLAAAMAGSALAEEIPVAHQTDEVRVASWLGADISGVEPGGVYSHLPPVMVELDGLGEDVLLWVELHRGDQERTNSVAVLADSRTILRRKHFAALNVPGLEKACAKDGRWMLVVKAQERGKTKTVSKVVFEVDRTLAPDEQGLVAIP